MTLRKRSIASMTQFPVLFQHIWLQINGGSHFQISLIFNLKQCREPPKVPTRPSIEANIIGLLSHPTLENSFLFNNNSVQVRLNFYCPSVCPSVCLSHFTFHFSLDNDRETAYFFLFSLPKQRETDKLFSFHFPRNGKPYRISLFTSQKAGKLFFLLFSLPKKREI